MVSITVFRFFKIFNLHPWECHILWLSFNCFKCFIICCYDYLILHLFVHCLQYQGRCCLRLPGAVKQGLPWWRWMCSGSQSSSKGDNPAIMTSILPLAVSQPVSMVSISDWWKLHSSRIFNYWFIEITIMTCIIPLQVKELLLIALLVNKFVKSCKFNILNNEFFRWQCSPVSCQPHCWRVQPPWSRAGNHVQNLCTGNQSGRKWQLWLRPDPPYTRQ